MSSINSERRFWRFQNGKHLNFTSNGDDILKFASRHPIALHGVLNLSMRANDPKLAESIVFLQLRIHVRTQNLSTNGSRKLVGYFQQNEYLFSSQSPAGGKIPPTLTTGFDRRNLSVSLSQCSCAQLHWCTITTTRFNRVLVGRSFGFLRITADCFTQTTCFDSCALHWERSASANGLMHNGTAHSFATWKLSNYRSSTFSRTHPFCNRERWNENNS